MRALAHIERITDLRPIEGADRIELADILGWHVIVRKGDFSVNDLVVYCEIDSVMPDRPEFEFLRPRKFRIKTIKMKGVISQGIAFPLSVLSFLSAVNVDEGDDVTENLGVTKYEVPIPTCLSGTKKSNFPGFIPKTDEERIQNCAWILDKYADKSWYITEKLDGTSATYYIKDGVFGVCSRNMELKDDESSKVPVYWKVAKDYHIEDRLRSLGYNVAVQGEIIGPGIQKNKYKLSNHAIFFYNVFDINERIYWNYFGVIENIQTKMKLNVVPIITCGLVIPESIDKMVEMSICQSTINPDIPAEGIVCRPVQEMQDLKGNRVSFKVVNPEFLLKFGE